jgi:RNA polymerase-binding protein DksA
VAKKASSSKTVAKKTAAPRGATKVISKAVRKSVAVKNAKPAAAPKPEESKPIKLKCTLSRKELAEYREMLLEKRRTLLGDMDGMHAEAMRDNRDEGTSDLSTMPVHMADVGTDNYEQEFTLGLLESERQLLREIDESLQRMTEGTYGVCLGTGKPINKSRLRAMPWAKFSIEYARMIEQGRATQQRQEASGIFEEEEHGEEEEHEDAPELPEIVDDSFEPEEDDLGM